MANLEQVAKACNITPRRLNQLAKEGAVPREGRGDYNLGKVMAAYIRYLQEALSSRSTEDDSGGQVRSLQAERTTLIKTQREREELELAKARGETISIQDHVKILGDVAMEIKAHILAVAPRLAADVVGETSRVMVQAKADKHLRQVLDRLSKTAPSITKPAKKKASKPAKKPKKKAAKTEGT